jgi:virginiamycin B lyase
MDADGSLEMKRGARSRRSLCLGSLIGLLAALVAPTAAAAVTEYPVPTSGSQPSGITVGPDGALWFTEENKHKIGRITTAGNITEYPIPTIPSGPSEITAGPDGALWFTENAASPPKIGRITAAGTCCDEFPLPPGSAPDGITTGPDGALWFTENGAKRIGRITVGGAIAHYDLPLGFRPGDITTGPDGRLWFTESEADMVGVISVTGPPITEYQLPLGTDPSGIVAFGDALWFTQVITRKIARIPTAGPPIAEFGPTGSEPSGIAVGPDGALWFTETGAHKIGRMTASGQITEFAIPTPFAQPDSIVAGPDGALWFTEFFGNKIGRIEPPALPLPQPPSQAPVATTSGSQNSPPAKQGCRVPKLRGLSARQAKKKLRRAGCRFRIRGKGKVVSTRPRPGKRTAGTVQVRAKRRGHAP